jgi:hypothetical protein
MKILEDNYTLNDEDADGGKYTSLTIPENPGLVL